MNKEVKEFLTGATVLILFILGIAFCAIAWNYSKAFSEKWEPTKTQNDYIIECLGLEGTSECARLFGINYELTEDEIIINCIRASRQKDENKCYKEFRDKLK